MGSDKEHFPFLKCLVGSRIFGIDHRGPVHDAVEQTVARHNSRSQGQCQLSYIFNSDALRGFNHDNDLVIQTICTK